MIALVSTRKQSWPLKMTLSQELDTHLTAADNAHAKRVLPRLHDLPIPSNIKVDVSCWGDRMREMADHIGARAVLLISDRFGGQEFDMPKRKELCPFLDVVGEKKAEILAYVFGGERLSIPVARKAIARARRAGVIAAARAGQVTVSQAAIIAGTSRCYMSHLINHTDEGTDCDPIELVEPRLARLLGDAAEIASDALAEVGAPGEKIAIVRAEIQELGN